MAHESANRVPVLVRTLYDEASPQAHVYEDPDYINGQTTLPTQQQHLVDPSGRGYLEVLESHREEHAEGLHPQRTVTASLQSSPPVAPGQPNEGHDEYYI